ncbi:MAG TPA: hypothetical protein DCW31_03755 [Lactobacillus sp.]|nr:hypothetical protein [Lactobacillus sp.]
MTPQKLLRHVDRITDSGKKKLLVVINPLRVYEFGLSTQPYVEDDIEWFTGDMRRVVRVLSEHEIPSEFLEQQDGKVDAPHQIYSRQLDEIKRRQIK